MSKNKSTPLVLVIVVAGLLVVVGAVAVSRDKDGPREHEVEGTLTSVDPAAGRASLEFHDPRKGGLVELEGDVPSSCAITVNGQPATLADLRIGDQATVKVLFEPDVRDASGRRGRRVTAQWIRVTRSSES